MSRILICCVGKCRLCAKEGSELFCLLICACIVIVKVMFNTAVHAEYIRDHKDYCFEFQNDSHSFNWKYVTAITSNTQ